MTRGLQSPSFTIQRAWHRIGNRRRKAIQPVPNAYEDAAQTIGGRKTHGDKSDGVYRKAWPPATYTQSLPSRIMPTNIFMTKLFFLIRVHLRSSAAIRKSPEV